MHHDSLSEYTSVKLSRGAHSVLGDVKGASRKSLPVYLPITNPRKVLNIDV